MSIIRMNAQCIDCLLNKYIGKIPPNTDEQTALAYKKGILRLLADAPDTMSAPEVVAQATTYKNATFGFSDDYAEIKRHFNALMLGKESEIARQIDCAADPLRAALSCAMYGNYIDFGALDNVQEETLQVMLQEATHIVLDSAEYEQFCADLVHAKSLVYFTDNCGEIVMDKLLIQTIQRRFPMVKIYVVVRGEAVLNDATAEDAAQVGLDRVVPVLHNGTNIAGTCIEKLPQDVRAIADRADVLIAKGQGNFETLRMCNRNVYYLFLCKCSMFANRFGVPQFSGMFLNDRRMQQVKL